MTPAGRPERLHPDDPAAAVAVVGAGLAGSLLALALARRGFTVRLLGPDQPSATGLSYGALGRNALGPWRALERRHGALGCRPCGLSIHGLPWLPSGLPPALQAALSPSLPFARVDGDALAAALPNALARCGVRREHRLVERLEAQPGGGWRLIGPADPPGSGPAGSGAAAFGAGGSQEARNDAPAAAVVLAAGVGCRPLWPSLPARLRFSWAGVIAVDRRDLSGSAAVASPWLARGLRGGIVRPWQLERPALENRAAALQAPAWVVDAGLAPRGEQILLGQITLVDPRLDPASPPEAAGMEERLRQGLARMDPSLAELPGVYRQVAVPYCLDGEPLVGTIPEAPGLWGFTGFRGAFTSVPPLAEQLAAQLAQELAR